MKNIIFISDGEFNTTSLFNINVKVDEKGIEQNISLGDFQEGSVEVDKIIE